MRRAESFDDFCRACLDLFKARRTKYVLIGGVAVTAVGEPRFTADLDALIYVDLRGVRDLVLYATRHGFTADVEAEVEAVAAGGSAQLVRGRFHLDLVVRSLFIEDQALARARTIKLFRRAARFPSPEDLLVLKLVAGRDQDMLDARGIVRRHGNHLDRRYIERTLEAVCELAEDHVVLERWRTVRDPG
ncbi:MAG: nucleotidyltransferase [Kofleriaceae bacterium]